MAAPITPNSPLPFLGYTVVLPDAVTVVELDPQPYTNTKEVILLNLSSTDRIFVQTTEIGSFPASGDILLSSGTPPNPGDTIDIGAATLTAVNGAPGVDEVQVDNYTNSVTFALDVAAAINNPANSFNNVKAHVVSPGNATQDGRTIRIISTLVGSAGNATVFSDTGAQWSTFAPAGQTSASPGFLAGGSDAIPTAAEVTAANSTILPASSAITLCIGSEGNRQPLATTGFWNFNPGSKLGIVLKAESGTDVGVNVTLVQNRGYPEGV